MELKKTIGLVLLLFFLGWTLPRTHTHTQKTRRAHLSLVSLVTEGPLEGNITTGSGFFWQVSWEGTKNRRATLYGCVGGGGI